MTESGKRGAGWSTGTKWKSCKMECEEKTVQGSRLMPRGLSSRLSDYQLLLAGVETMDERAKAASCKMFMNEHVTYLASRVIEVMNSPLFINASR